MGFGGYLQANTAVDVLIGPFIDDTDGKTAETALTLSQGDIKLSKNGQALAQKNDDTAAAHDANGYYNCELNATDTNTEGTLTLIVHESGALPVRHDFMVLSQAAYTSLVTAKDTGYMDVNVKAISEDTTAPDNLELMYDGTGYAGGTTKLDVNVATIANNAITANAINADAITNAKIADNAIAVENIADNAITAAKIANGAIDNATFAADVGSTAYATNIIALAAKKAIDEYDPPTKAELDTAQGAVTVSAIANGAITAAAIATGAIDADALAADAGTEIGTAVWATAARTLTALDEDDTTIDLNATIAAAVPAVGAIADAVWDEALAGHAGAGTAGATLTAAGSAGDPWATLIPGAYGAGTAGLLLGTTIPAAIDAIDNYVDSEITTITNELAKVPKSDSNVTWNATALGSIQSECTDALNAYDPPTNAEMPTAAAIADAVWDEASTGHTDAGKAGAQMWTDIDAILADTNELQTDDTPGALAAIDAKIDTIDGIVDNILVDTGTTLDTLIKDIPTVAEFEARTLAAADYTVVSDLGTVQTGDSFARLGAPAGASVSADIAAVKAETAAIVADTNELQTDITNGGRVDSLVDAIKAKTDSLTFTQAGQVDANVQYINDVALTGDGSATPWGPA